MTNYHIYDLNLTLEGAFIFNLMNCPLFVPLNCPLWVFWSKSEPSKKGEDGKEGGQESEYQ